MNTDSIADCDTCGTTCDHCGLSLGPWPHERDVDGIDRRFCCYGCFIGWQVTRGGGEEATAVGLLLRLGVGGFLAMNIMLFSLAIYSRDLGVSDPAVRQVFHYILWAFATPVMVLLGGPFFIEAIRDTLRGRLNASILITIGAIAAYLYSVIATLNGDERVYFDTTTMVLGLFTLGRYLEANGRARAMRNLAPMLGPHRAQVSILKGESEETIPLSHVQIGDLVRVQPGDKIVVDGVVMQGEGFVDETWLTGEGRSIEKSTNSLVRAGTINLDGILTIRSTTKGLATHWAGICTTLHDALAQSSIIQTVTDRLAAWFVPTVLVTSFLTVWYWVLQGPVDAALMHGLAVLIVSCPCALGLAAPLATALALEELARGKCLIRSGDALYRLGNVQAIAFDKTGTLTMGEVRVGQIIAKGATSNEILRRAAAIELGSRHPVAKGIVERAADLGLSIAKADSVRTIPGRGIRGLVGGESIFVGTSRMFVEMGWNVPRELRVRLTGQEAKGLTGVYVGWNSEIHGLVLLRDQVRTETLRTVRSLQQMGMDVVILSGDRPGTVSRIANECGIECWQSELLPARKADYVSGLRQSGGSVVMVGDGINDALALQAADVGIAVGDGVDLARESADAVLSEAGISNLPEIIGFAKRAKQLVLSNLVWALAYNMIAIALAVTGNLLPIFAAALMAGSSFVVIANSLRLSNDNFSKTVSV